MGLQIQVALPTQLEIPDCALPCSRWLVLTDPVIAAEPDGGGTRAI